jgi:flagella synthesis protein FlgN
MSTGETTSTDADRIDPMPDGVRDTPYRVREMQAVLTSEVGEAKALLDILNEEFNSLKGRDAESLEKQIAQKTAHVETLARVTRSREELLGINGEAVSFERWAEASQVDSNHRVHKLWMELSEVALQLKRQNEINGFVVVTGLKATQSLLGALRGESAEPALYGAKTNATTSRTRALASA